MKFFVVAFALVAAFIYIAESTPLQNENALKEEEESSELIEYEPTSSLQTLEDGSLMAPEEARFAGLIRLIAKIIQIIITKVVPKVIKVVPKVIAKVAQAGAKVAKAGAKAASKVVAKVGAKVTGKSLKTLAKKAGKKLAKAAYKGVKDLADEDSIGGGEQPEYEYETQE